MLKVVFETKISCDLSINHMSLLYSILINERDYYPKLFCSCLEKQVIRITIKSENKSRKFNENISF